MKIDNMIHEVLSANDFTEVNYFQDLRSGTMSFEEFVNSQKQFYHAVIHFTAPLALVAGAIPTYEQRVNIIKNLWEEHGEGDMTKTHGKTFTEFLRRLTKTEVQHVSALGAVNDFNNTLDEVAKNNHFIKSVAMIGMIEQMFSEISSFIGAAVLERNWMKHQEMIHYSVHQDLDVIHAKDFFDILIPYEESHEALIQEGLNVGAVTFLNLYRGLREEVRV